MALVWNDIVNAYNNGTTLDVNELKAYVAAQSVVDSTGTAKVALFYSGDINGTGTKAYQLAQKIAFSSGDTALIVDRTDAGKTLRDVKFDDVFERSVNASGGDASIAKESIWRTTSEKFAEQNTLPARTITPEAQAGRTWSDNELTKILSPGNLTPDVDGH